MGIEHPEERVRDLRELVVDLKVNPRREQCKGLDEAFDMGIFTFIGFEEQPTRHLGIRLGEFLPQLSEDRQFPLVVFEQRLLH
jgi:hypothetical protein